MRWQVVSNELGEGYHQYALMIFDNDDERSALDVFEEAYRDWRRYLGEWWFIEGTLVAPNPKLVQGL
jgi:hypothetical protein